MRKEIEKLIEKWEHEYQECEIPSISPRVMFDFGNDLRSLLKLNQSQLDMVKYARHIHVAGDGKDIDTCKKCGHDVQHGIHLRYGENLSGYAYTKDKTE